MILVTIIGLFFPSTVRLSKAINIHATCDDLGYEIADMSKWTKWNPFVADAYRQQILRISNDSLSANNFKIKWKYKSPDKLVAVMDNGIHRPGNMGWHCITYPHTDSLTLQWFIDVPLRWYPWERFSSLILENSYGPKMQEGLQNLKQLIEKY